MQTLILILHSPISCLEVATGNGERRVINERKSKIKGKKSRTYTIEMKTKRTKTPRMSDDNNNDDDDCDLSKCIIMNKVKKPQECQITNYRNGNGKMLAYCLP